MRKVAAVFSVLLVLSLGLAGSFVAVTGTVEAEHTSSSPTDVVVVNASGGTGVTNTTIQGGVDHANPGDTVLVEEPLGEETYDESVVVNTTNVTIFTNESVTLNGSTVTGPAFNVTSAEGNVSNVELSGFTITNYETGVLVDGVEATTPPTNLDMRNISVVNNTFRDISGTAVSVDQESGEFERVTIAENTVTNATDGVSVSVDGSVSTENVTILNNSMGGEIAGTAVSVSASGSTAALTDVNVVLNNGSESGTGLEVSLQDSASLSDVNVSGNEFASTDGDAISLATGSSSTPTAGLSNIEIGANLLNGSDSGASVNVTTRGSATVDDITVDGVAGNASENGVVVEARGSSDISGVEVTGSLLRGSTNSALSLSGAGGTVQDVIVDSNGLNASGSGLRIAASAGGSVTNVSVTDNNASSGSAGLVVVSEGASSTVEDIDVTDTLLNETGGTGVSISASDSSEVTDVSLDTVDARNNQVGLNVTAVGTATVSNLSTDTTSFGESMKANSDAGILTAQGGTIQDVAFTSTGFNGTAGTGLSILAANGTVRNVSLTDVNAQNNSVGLNASAFGSGTISDLSTDTVGFGQSEKADSNAGILAAEGSSATIEDVAFELTGFNETNGTGLQITATEGEIRNVSLTDVNAQSNDVGLDVSAVSGATIANLSTDTAGFGESATDAGVLSAEGGSATIEDVEFASTGFNESGGTGLTLLADGGEISNVSLDTVLAANNSAGLNATATGSGVIEDLTLTETGFNKSDGTGLAFSAEDGTIRNVSLDTVTAGNNSVGIDATATGTGTISGISTDTALFGESDGNAGVFEAIGTDAVIEDLSFESTGFNESVGTGLTLLANDGEISNVSLDTVLAANNSAGLNATATGNGVIENLTLTETGFNKSDGTGLALSADDGEIRDVSLDTVTAGNNDVGIDATATGTGTISGISTDTALFGESDGNAGVFEAIGTDAVIEDLSFESTGFNESVGTGLTLLANGGEISNVSLDTVLAANNSAGLNATATGSGVIEDLSFETAGFNKSDGTGLAFSAEDGTIRNVSLDTVTAGNNSVGIDATATGTGTISGISTDTVLFGESDGNAGVFEASGANATIEDLAFELTGFNKSGGTGLTLSATDGEIRNVSLDTVTAGNNDVGIDATATGTGTISGISTDTVLFGQSDGNAG
ncbi:MAG: beta strand repeat-containing protein, partial [Halobacteriales archaeon]